MNCSMAYANSASRASVSASGCGHALEARCAQLIASAISVGLALEGFLMIRPPLLEAIRLQSASGQKVGAPYTSRPTSLPAVVTAMAIVWAFRAETYGADESQKSGSPFDLQPN